MSNRLPVIGIIVAVILFLAYSSIFVVNERQQAIVLRFGEIVDVKSEPGIYFKAPFGFFEADNVHIIEDRVMRFDPGTRIASSIWTGPVRSPSRSASLRTPS